jgi:hypothetical protein
MPLPDPATPILRRIAFINLTDQFKSPTGSTYGRFGNFPTGVIPTELDSD